MPSRFFDYEFDLLQSSQKKDKRKTTGHRKPNDTVAATSRRNSTSAPTSTTTTRSSVSSTSGTSSASSSWHPHQNPHRNVVAQQCHGSHNLRDPYREDQVEPTPQIQEWAHQMHIQQRTRYWWCSSCYPKPQALEIPREKVLRRVRIQEPTHAYE